MARQRRSDEAARTVLIQMARDNMAHVSAGTIEQAPDIVRVPGHQYIDLERWQQYLAGLQQQQRASRLRQPSGETLWVAAERLQALQMVTTRPLMALG